MTDKEMTELFAVMLLAWPNAETFKGGIAKLAPTIKLWTSCTTDVDFWTGQQAVIRLCQQCKFPPTIAEFRKQVEGVNRDIKALCRSTFQEIRHADVIHGSLDAFYRDLPDGSLTRMTIDVMGGLGKLTSISKDCSGRKYVRWNWRGIEDACKSIIRRQPALVGGQLPALTAPAPRR